MRAFWIPRNSTLIRDSTFLSGSNLFLLTVNPPEQAASWSSFEESGHKVCSSHIPLKWQDTLEKCPLSTLLSNRDFLSLKSGFVWEFNVFVKFWLDHFFKEEDINGQTQGQSLQGMMHDKNYFGRTNEEAQAGHLEGHRAECWTEPGGLWFSLNGLLLPLKFCHQKCTISTIQYGFLN